MSIYRMRTQFGGILKFILIGISFIFLVGAIYSFGTAPSGGPNGRGADEAVATVNGLPITRGDYTAATESLLQNARDMGNRSPLQFADVKAYQFQNMVMQMSILAAAKAENIDISENKVDEKVAEQVTQALNANRQLVRGKLTKKQLQEDPRDDQEYARQLQSIGSSVDKQAEAAESRINRSAIQAQIAWDGLMKKIKSSAKSVTEEDVKNSYNVYKVDEIMVSAGGPKETVATYAKKLQAEAKKGTSFAKIAADSKGGPVPVNERSSEYAFETLLMMPQLGDAMQKMKPGDVSPVIETPYGTLIIKVNSMQSKMPAKFDTKMMKDRRKMISQARESQAMMAFQKDLQEKVKVTVSDPELKGYWYLSKAQQSMGNQADYMKNMNLAMAALKDALKVRSDNVIVASKLAQLYYQQGDAKKATSLLYPMLEGDAATTEGADLRILLGDALLKTGEKDRAITQFERASEAGRFDKSIHQQLVTRFQQLGLPDKVAAENKTIADIEKREAEARSASKMPAPAPKRGE